MKPSAGSFSEESAPTTEVFASLSTPVVPTRTVLLDADPAATDPVAAKRAEIRRYFHQTCELYERLFALIRDDASLYERHEPLRHPLIFYFAHPAVFYLNKLTAGRYVPERLDPALEAMMAVGVDEMSWDDLNTAHYDWPSVAAVRRYRAAMRQLVDGFIQKMPLELPIRWNSPAWLILMGIEHERIHLETSSVIMRQMPLDELRHGDELSAEERRLWGACRAVGVAPSNEWLPVAATHVRLGKRDDDRTYGWDNEYGSDEIDLPAFRAGKRLVSNADFLEFVTDGGYRETAWWTEEGRGWLHYTRAEHPRFWTKQGNDYLQRNLLEEIPLPLNWPVEVNCLEAQAYCSWLAAKTDENVLLPTEAHWQVLRNSVPGDLPSWKSPPGNINLERFASSCPVDACPQGDFCDVVGNVWQWTRSPIMPFKGFEVHPLYDDFSVPTFDGRHNLIKGGSWISTGNETLASARYAFRRHFFQHAGFRTIIEEPGNEAVTAGSRLYETDQLVAQYLDFHYWDAASGGFDAAAGGFDAASGGPATRLGVPNFPKACVDATMPHVPADRRERCLDIGCSVGRSAFEFARFFRHVDAIDFSARFIQAGVRLQQGNEVLYEVPTEGELTAGRMVSLDALGLTDAGKQVLFMQGDACNLKAIYSDYDLVFAGNLIDRLYDPALFLQGIASRLRPGGLLVITSPYTWLEEYTQKSKWLGGRREHGEPLSTFAGLSRCLGGQFSLAHRQDVPFVIRETARKHQHTIAEMTIWRRSDDPSATIC
ncbi:MAG: 5-histidylcysteine sulfoxide synthase [Planctomycetia bacterium]|nr:5-histidylcysteine sulfoxide synthase [Planctomycetia bacterium]